MRHFLKRWFIPAVFVHDEEKYSRARLLIYVTTAVAIFVLFAILGSILGGNVPQSTLALTAALLILTLISHALALKGRLRLAGILMMVQGYVFITAAVASIGTIRTPVASAYMFLIIVGGAFFARRGIWLTAIASSLSIGGLILLENAGMLPHPDIRLTIAQWITYSVLFALTGSMSYLDNQLTREALDHSKKEIAERKLAEERYQQLLEELEERVRARTAELSASNDALERASRLKSEFLASMSHELRTPLTGILGLSEVLLLQAYGPLTEKQLKAVKNIESSGRHLLDLINDILDLTKIEAGKVELQFAPCPVGEICQASLQLVKGMAHKKKHQVGFNMAPASLTVRADARRLKQMLVNLLSNAIKFTPENGQLGLDVSADEPGGWAYFRVWDKGIGIAPEHMGKLFRPFTQIDSDLARQNTGTGLGLSLVHRMAEAHGGQIKVESAPGEGSTFTIVLPLIQNEPAPAAPVASETMLPASVEPSETSIPAGLVMMADDNEQILNMVGDFLKSRGYQVVTTSSGFELLEQAPRLHPQILLVDIQMPGMDGIETMRRVRAHHDPLLRGVPIIAVTALAMTGDREKCLEAGANDYMSKPIALTQLADRIRTLLEQRR